MAPLKCERPGCSKQVEETNTALALQILQLHDAQVHGIANKPEKPRRPELVMVGDAVEDTDWEQFAFKYEQYKTLAGVTKDSSSHLLECLSSEVYSVLFSTYGRHISSQTEADLLGNIKRLVVRQRNTMASIMAVLRMSQDSDQAILNYIAQLRAAARQCDFKLKCDCGKDNDFTESIILYKLVAGVSDMELQEELLTKADLTLSVAEKLAVAKESAKFSQAAMSGEGVSGLKSSHQRNKADLKKACSYCGGHKQHTDRKKECPAWTAKCPCGINHHYQHLCRRKGIPPTAKADSPKPETTTDKPSKDNTAGSVSHLLNIHHRYPLDDQNIPDPARMSISQQEYQAKLEEEHTLASVSTADLKYHRQSRKWIQRPPSKSKVDFVPVNMSVAWQSFAELGVATPKQEIVDRSPSLNTEGVADTGCTVLCGGLDTMRKLKIPRSVLINSNITLYSADRRPLTVLGAIPVDITVRGNMNNTTRQLLHIVSELSALFISKTCLQELRIISDSFPLPEQLGDAVDALHITGGNTPAPTQAPCGCPVRTTAPDPPVPDFPFTEENIPKLRDMLVQHYSTSTMNMCSHQPLPKMTGPPLQFSLKPDAVPHAIHSPATIPVHWMDQVKKQLLRDVELGILEEVPANEPTLWMHRMVVVRKHDGSPRRTVDMQKLNDASLRHTHPVTSPYLKAMTVPKNAYKTVTDAWEGYHSVLLDKESSKLTSFVTPFGCFRYLTNPQGNHVANDAYNKRFDSVTAHVQDVERQVDDSLLWKPTITECFSHTAEYLTLLGNNGILQNPAKFQFCKQEVDWSGFRISSDGVRPMPHISQSIRDFPTPINRTDMRSFMALAQQVSYATAVAPRLLHFRELLRDKVPWFWDRRMDEVFTHTKNLLADKVEEGIKSFDPARITALLTDWCKHGVGFVMMQKHCHCPDKPDSTTDMLCCTTGWLVCMVGSRFTHTAEANYSATEGELLAQADALLKTKYFTLGCPQLILGTDHMPLLGLHANRNLDSIDNPRLVRLKQKTLGWRFQVVYIPGKRIGGTDALSRYGVRHCSDAGNTNHEQQSSQQAELSVDQPSVRQHLVGLLASSGAVSQPSHSAPPLLLDSDTHFLTSLASDVGPVTWDEIRRLTVKDTTMQSLSNLVQSTFPQKRNDLPPELQQYWASRSGLTVYDGVLLYNDRTVIPPSARPRVLQVLHSAHQGVTGMTLRAEQSVFWPGMSEDIRNTRAACRTCHIIAPSQPNMPPVQPITPAYPFQHICCDYFALHGNYFGVVVDRFSGWFNIYKGSGGATCLVDMMTKLFQDMGVADTITSDGGPEFKSEKFKACLRQYGVQHRLTSVGFAHANTRAELAVKSAKRLLRDHMSPTGGLDNVAVTRAVLTYRNTPDRDTGLSPAYMLLGRQLKDFLPSKPNQPPPLGSHRDLSDTWQDIAEWRELALAKRSAKDQENLSAHVKEHAPLELGDHVMVQNQSGNQPLRWSKRGVVVQVLPNRQYQVRMDGSRRITLRNRKFLRKFTPLHEDPSNPLKHLPTSVPENMQAGQQTSHTQPAVPTSPHPQQDQRPPLPMPQQQPVNTVPSSTAAIPQPDPAQTVGDWSPPGQTVQPQQDLHQNTSHPSMPPATQTESAPLPALMHPTSGPVRRSSRSNKGVTSKFNDYTPGDEFDVSSLHTECDSCNSTAQGVSHLQPAPYYVQSITGTGQLPAPHHSPAQVLNPYNQYHPYQHYTTQNMAPVLSPDKNRVFVSGLNDPAENRVFVSDGYSWKEYNLEKVFSW